MPKKKVEEVGNTAVCYKLSDSVRRRFGQKMYSSDTKPLTIQQPGLGNFPIDSDITFYLLKMVDPKLPEEMEAYGRSVTRGTLAQYVTFLNGETKENNHLATELVIAFVHPNGIYDRALKGDLSLKNNNLPILITVDIHQQSLSVDYHRTTMILWPDNTYEFFDPYGPSPYMNHLAKVTF
jgi:hypothetical protein